MPDKSPVRPASETIRRGHESRDANVKGIAMATLILIATCVAVQMAVYFYLGAKTETLPKPKLVLAAKPGNLFPHQDLVAFQREQQQELNSYGWIDREHGVVRIPIERAMDLLVQRGLPVRSESSGGGKSPLQLQQERAKQK